MPKEIHAYEVLRRPVVTEKSTALSGQNKYVFEVALGANKPQIKEAVERAFDVKVQSVNTTMMRGARAKRRAGRRRSSPCPRGRSSSSRACRGTGMPIQKFRPTLPGRRGASGFTFDELTKKKPEKRLLASKKRTSGRSGGKISVRH